MLCRQSVRKLLIEHAAGSSAFSPNFIEQLSIPDFLPYSPSSCPFLCPGAQYLLQIPSLLPAPSNTTRMIKQNSTREGCFPCWCVTGQLLHFTELSSMEMSLEPRCHTQVSLLKYDLLWESFPLLSFCCCCSILPSYWEGWKVKLLLLHF